MDHDDEHHDRLEHVEFTATVALMKETARQAGGGLFFLVLPLVSIVLTRGVLALGGTLALRGTSQLVAMVVLVAVAARRVGYRRGRGRTCRCADADAPRRWAPAPVVSWKTARAVVRRAPIMVLATVGIAQFGPWPAFCAAAVFLVAADLVLARINAHRVWRVQGLTAFLDGGDKSTWEV